MTTEKRFKEELEDHIADGGDQKELGDKRVLTESFQIYNREKVARTLILLIGVFITTFVITELMYLGINESTDDLVASYLPVPILFVVIFGGMALIFPIMLLYLFFLGVMQLFIPGFNPEFPHLFPFFAAIFWTYVATILTCTPQMILHIRENKL